MEKVRVKILEKFNDFIGVPFIAGSEIYMTLYEFEQYKGMYPNAIKLMSPQNTNKVRVRILKKFNDFIGIPFVEGSEIYMRLYEFEEYKGMYPDSIELIRMEITDENEHILVKKR